MLRSTLALLIGSLLLVGNAIAADDTTFSVGDGKLTFKASEGWKKIEPKIRIIEAEFQIPAAEKDENPGRLTIMGAGGSVDANIERWYTQFEQADGSDSKKAAKTEKVKVAGQDVHIVDVAGTYRDMPSGPFGGGKPVMREGYRMLAAIVETDKAGNYFLKFYGPKATVAENEKAFRAMVESLEVK